MEKKNNFKRRVSFASTLHVRLFDEEELENEVSGDLQPCHQNDNLTRLSDANNFLFSTSANQTPDQSLLLNEIEDEESMREEPSMSSVNIAEPVIDYSSTSVTESTPVAIPQVLSSRATPTTSFLFDNSTPKSLFRLSKTIKGTPKSAELGRLSLFKSTPRSVSKFGLSSVKSSATPLLDRAIFSVKKPQIFVDNVDANQTFDESYADSFRVSPAKTYQILQSSNSNLWETEPRIAMLNIKDVIQQDVAAPAAELGDTSSIQLDDIQNRNSMISENAESIVLDHNSTHESINLDGSFVKSEFMELDESTILKESGSMNNHDQVSMSFTATPKKSDYATGFPKLSPAILEDKEKLESPATMIFNQVLESAAKSNGRVRALDSPVIKSGLDRLSQGKFRDSIAPFFRSKTPAKSSYTPKSVSSLRFSSTFPQESPSASSVTTSQAPSPAMGPLKRNSRDSVANFFNQSNLRQSMVSLPAESPKSVVSAAPSPAQPYHPRGRARDSIAPFFSTAGFDEEDASASESDVAQQQDESIISTQDQSVDMNFVEDADVSIQLDESSQTTSKSSVHLDQPLSESQESDNGFKTKARARDSVAAFFSAPLSADSSFQSEKSMVSDESLDLTENRKGNPFWTTDAEKNESSQENGADESIVFDRDGASRAIMSTPHKEFSVNNPQFEGISPVTSSQKADKKTAPKSSIKRSSTRKSSPVKKIKVEHIESPSPEISSSSKHSPSQPSPTRVTRSRSRDASPVKPTPKKSTAVTPMRRAVAQKSLRNALVSPSLSGIIKAESPKPSSTKRSKRKSVGGDLLKALGSRESEEELYQSQSSSGSTQSSQGTESSQSSQGIESTQSFQGTESTQSSQGIESLNSSQESDSSVIETPTALEQDQDSFLMDFQAPESQSNLVGDGMIDLMDEQHLSIMDASVVLEEENSIEQNTCPILDLADFNEATGIKFGDYAVLSEETEEMSQGTAIDCSIDILETNHYHNGCVELMDKINCLEEEASALQRNISMNTPLLFDEFSQGTRKEREVINTQLKSTKEYCYELAKLEWYSWKGATLDYLYSCLQEDCRQLQGQHEYIKPILAEFEEVGTHVQAYYDELSKMVPLARDEVNDKMNHIQKTSTCLIEEKTVRRENMDGIRKQIQLLRQEALDIQEATIQAEKKDAEYTARIAYSERTCGELTVFDPADLTLLQAKYSVLTSSHAWKPLSLSPGKQIWLYDDILEARFSNQGDSYLVQSQIHEHNPSNKQANYNHICRQIMSEVTPERMNNLLKIFDKSRGFIANGSDLKSVLIDMSIMWESIKTLYRDVKKARHFTSSGIEWVNVPAGQSDLFRIKTKFFNLNNRVHLEAEFSFSTKEGMMYYPNGKWNFDYQLSYGNVRYGFRMSQRKIIHAFCSESLKTSVESIENGPDLVARCCRFIQESLNVSQ